MEKKKKNIIKYKTAEFIHGGMKYLTECPYGELNRYTLKVNHVGDIGCERCRYHISQDKVENNVVCVK